MVQINLILIVHNIPSEYVIQEIEAIRQQLGNSFWVWNLKRESNKQLDHS
jgi:hypothetical protein